MLWTRSATRPNSRKDGFFFVGELHEDSVGHGGYIGIMEKKMETTGIIGVI